LKYVSKSFASRRAIDIIAPFDPPLAVETTILRRPEEHRIEYGFVDRCGAGGGDSAVERICETSFAVSLRRSNGVCQAKVGTYRPSTTRVTLEIELWASGEDMMKDGEGAPVDVQLSIFQLSRIDAEAPNVGGDD